MRRIGRTASCIAIGGIVVAIWASRGVLGADPAAADAAGDLEASYEEVLGALKNPPTRGVLIAEVEPDSPVGAAGLRAGDIITEYYGERIDTLKGLREQVAEATARAIVDPNVGPHVLIKAYRGGKTVVSQLPRGPLGIRAIAVQAGVPGPRNPAPNLRGTITFDWEGVLASAAADLADGPAAFRTTQQFPAQPPATGYYETWLGWQTLSTEPDGTAALSGKFVIHGTDPDRPSPAAGAGAAPATSVRFHMLLGDFKTSAPFILDAVTTRYVAADGAMIDVAAGRMGATLRANVTAVGGNPPRNTVTSHQTSLPQNAMVEAGLPIVAAALPHDGDFVIALQLLSVRDLLVHPGYVLQTLGKKPLPAFPGAATLPAAQTAPAGRAAETAWRVDLLFCGMLVESYWFTDERRLLAIRTEAAEPMISRRVATAAIAAAGDSPAQTQPQPAPAAPADHHP